VSKEFASAQKDQVKRRGTPDRGPAKERPARSVPRVAAILRLQRAVADPARASPGDIVALGRRFGNQAVSGLLQAKLIVNAPGDVYEQEADRVAERVMSMRTPPSNEASSLRGQPAAQRQEEEEELQMTPVATQQDVQRQEEEELQMTPVAMQQDVQRQEEEEELQMTPVATQQDVQRQEEEEELQMTPVAMQQDVQRQEEEEELQMTPVAMQQDVQRQEEEEEVQMMPAQGIQRLSGGTGTVATPEVESTIQQARGSGQSLADDVRGPMEQAFGADFSGVRVHTDERADALNRSLQAKAFTTGQDIFFRSGEYQPGNSSGQQLLAHELTHTVQQGASARIQRWGPLGTSHSQVTKAALAAIDDENAKQFYNKRRIKRYISQCAADMDNRENAKFRLVRDLTRKIRGVYPVYKRMGARKKWKGLRYRIRPRLERVKAWEDLEGYDRDPTEQVNHAETGMYELDANEGMARARTQLRINDWYQLAVNEGKRQVEAETEGGEADWNGAFLRLGLALHTIEDIGAHNYGIPDWGRHERGHDPRRFVRPPYYEIYKTIWSDRMPRSYDLYQEGASFGDCDNASKNPSGYADSVQLAKEALEDFADKFVGIKPRLKSKGLRKLLGGWLPTWMARGAKTGSYWKNWYYPIRTPKGIKMVYLPKK
jgi:hypothetical protein